MQNKCRDKKLYKLYVISESKMPYVIFFSQNFGNEWIFMLGM